MSERTKSNVARFYRTFAPTLERVLRAKGARPDDVREAVQDAFLALIEHGIGDEGDLRGWLVTAARNSLCDRARRQRVRDRNAEATLPPGRRPAVENEFDTRRLLGRVSELVVELPEAHRQALVESRINGNSSDGGTAPVGASAAATERQRVHRAVESLCDELERASVVCPWCGGD